MIGELVDKLVGILSPTAEARRSHARRVVKRGYEAARTDRLNSRYNAKNQSADLEMYGDADEIRARSRQLIRDNAYARGVQRAFLRNVVGCGICPKAATDDEAFNEVANEYWDIFQQESDVTGRQSFYQQETLALSEIIEGGEVLVHHTSSPNRNRLVPYAIELIESDRFDSSSALHKRIGSNNQVRRGVEVNSIGEPVNYWLYESHPNDLNTMWSVSKPHAASEFEHIYKQERVGQSRGVSWYAPVLRWLRDLHYYTENEMQASAVASCFTAAVTTLAGPADGGLGSGVNASADSDGNEFEFLEPGMVARLLPGEDISVINPARSHADNQVWIDLMIRAIAMGSGVSYERLARDYRNTTYSSNRAGDLEDRREFRPLQDMIGINMVCPVYRRFISACVEVGLPGMPTPNDFISDFHKWTKHEHRPPGWEWVDPLKEVTASVLALENDLTNLELEHGKRGLDTKAVFAGAKRAETLRESSGLAPKPVEAEPDSEARSMARSLIGALDD